MQLSEEIDTTEAYANRVFKKQNGVVNKTFVQMMDALGYDIELTYVKRGKIKLIGRNGYVKKVARN